MSSKEQLKEAYMAGVAHHTHEEVGFPEKTFSRWYDALASTEPEQPVGEGGAHNYVVFRCDVDDSTIVSIEAPERGNDVYLGVAECPDMRTAQVVMESLRARDLDTGNAGLLPPKESEHEHE